MARKTHGSHCVSLHQMKHLVGKPAASLPATSYHKANGNRRRAIPSMVESLFRRIPFRAPRASRPLNAPQGFSELLELSIPPVDSWQPSLV
jgi:hypothetical protein